MRKDLSDVLKAAIIIGMAAVAFYLVFPKYHHVGGWKFRLNSITGQVEKFSEDKWVTIEEYYSPKRRFEGVTDPDKIELLDQGDKEDQKNGSN